MNKSTVIKKRAFTELPKERCSYCQNLERKLEKERPYWLFACNMKGEKLALWFMSKSPYSNIKRKLDDCKFPYCKCECENER
jgi:hypothetical protein